MIERMLGPNPISPLQLSLEVGIGNSTLCTWKNEALNGIVGARTLRPGMQKKKPQDWTAQEKVRVVLAAAALGDEELGAFLRKEGLHEEQLEQFKQEMVEGLEQAHKQKRSHKQQASEDGRRIRQLEREIERKDRALSEAAALLLLKKKVQQIWGDEDDDTASNNER
jgi:transposase